MSSFRILDDQGEEYHGRRGVGEVYSWHLCVLARGIMNEMDSIKKNIAENEWSWIFFSFAFLMTILPISSQSLWIDEGISTWFAFQENFPDVIRTIKNTDGAEALMPGYVIYMWAWVKAFSISEFSLRLSNLPFVTIMLFLFIKLPVNRVFKYTLLLLTCFSPFLWVYLNELRSYTALFAFSAIILTGFLFYFYGDSTIKIKLGPYLTVLGLLIGFFFNISIGFTAAALIPTSILIHRQTKNRRNNYLSDWKKPILFSTPFFMVLSGYYFRAVSAGSGGRLQGLTDGPTLKNIAFCFYEFLGFSGIGPPRNLIRENPTFSAFGSYIYWIGVAVVVMICILFYIVVSCKKNEIGNRFLRNPYLWGFVVGFFVFCVFAFTTKFVFYGRHVIFLYPFFIFALAYITNEIWSKKNLLVLGHILAASFLLICLVSDLRLRFFPEYFKDDYRSAVSTAISLAANDEPIFWAADFNTGAYYGLEYDKADFKRPSKIKPLRKVYAAVDLSIKEIEERISSFESGILVLSKEDLFDQKNGWSNFITAYHPVEIKSYNTFKIYKFKL